MDFHLIYYKEEIVKWLDECENAQNLKETIKQYKSLISQIYGEKIFKSKKLLGNIQKSQEKLQTIMMMFTSQKLIISYLMFMKF